LLFGADFYSNIFETLSFTILSFSIRTMNKKNLLHIVILLIANTVFAQAPAGYYNTAEGKKGDELKSALYNIIKGHKQYYYTESKKTDVWDILKESDRDPANPSNVILLYTGLSVNADQEYNNGNGWTREHVWAKIHGNFGTEPGAGTDAHHLRPCSDKMNSERSSRWFAECSSPVYYNGSATGCYMGTSEWTWEPRAEVKGDVARMIFYMATRYEGENGEPDLEIVDYLPSENNTTAPVFAKLSDLLVWNLSDPVDDFEMNRNNVIYSYQKNRNPFIDHPEYANLIWGENSDMPMFTSNPETDARVGLPFIYDVSAYIADSSQLTFNLEQSPEWLSMTDYGDGTALLAGVPDANASGSYIVSLTVTTSTKKSATQSFYIEVENLSDAADTPAKNTDVIIANGRLLVTDTKNGNARVFDIIGNMLIKMPYTDEIDITTLKSGIYIIEIEKDGNVFRHRFAIK